LRSHYITTNYDYLVETILDAISSEDEPAEAWCYRGISQATDYVQTQWFVTNLLKINGGFEVTRPGGRYKLEYRHRPVEEVRQSPPTLMLPSREQDYRDGYFQSVFPKAVRLLRESQVLVIVGYIVPEEDAVLRFLLRQFAEHETDAVGKSVFYVGTSSARDQKDRVRKLFPYWRAFDVPAIHFYGKGLAAWARRCNPELR
jgi:hypothetical protein